MENEDQIFSENDIEDEDLSDNLDDEEYNTSENEKNDLEKDEIEDESSNFKSETTEVEEISKKQIASEPSEDIHKKSLVEFNSNLLNLAKRAKMNTNLKCRIFCIVISAEVNNLIF